LASVRLDDRFTRAEFQRGGDALAKVLTALIAAELPREHAAGWLAELIGELERLGHVMRREDDHDGELHVWGDFALISCDVVAHDLALFVHGRFAGDAPMRIDRLEALWQKT
jgi:hypothetical protein